ncbi:MAG: M28 family peptidase [Candidatus Hodarchaeales archaeon]|jgi:hypothetical protein
MTSFLNLLLVLFIFFTTESVTTAQPGSTEKDSRNYLKSNLEYLASDLLEGRETATRGAKLAALYIAEQLETYDVKSFGDSETYFQNFDLLVKSVNKDSKIEVTDSNGNVEELELGTEFFLSTTEIPSAIFNNQVGEIVFASYGITTEDNEYDNYEKLDVKDKVVLVLEGSPGKDGKRIFTGEDTKKFEELSYKFKNAMDHGAAGLLLFPAANTIKYWRYTKLKALSSSYELLDEEIKQSNIDVEAIPVVKLSEDAAIKLLSDEKYDYQDFMEAIDENKIPSVFYLKKKIKFDYKTYSEVKVARNILGIIEGRDDELKNEYIVFSAHYDHAGIINGEIYNGADDNGSGTVTVLEAARRLALLKNNKRSILVIFHTAEEKGLLGSKYLTSNSDFMKNVVVNINVDMVGREDTESIYCIGSDKLSTELYQLVEEVNSETVNFELDYEYNHPSDPNRYYYRSDHYNYAKQNIPIVFFYDHMTEDYHKPSDDVDKINFEKLDKITTLVTELALRITNLDHRLIVDKHLEETVGAK